MCGVVQDPPVLALPAERAVRCFFACGRTGRVRKGALVGEEVPEDITIHQVSSGRARASLRPRMRGRAARGQYDPREQRGRDGPTALSSVPPWVREERRVPPYRDAPFMPDLSGRAALFAACAVRSASAHEG